MGLEAAESRVAGVVVGREVTHGRFTIEEAKSVIAEGPPISLEPKIKKPRLAPAISATASAYRQLAEELEMGAAHARTAATRYLDGEQARGAAHGLGVSGHLEKAQSKLAEIARQHADKSTPR